MKIEHIINFDKFMQWSSNLALLRRKLRQKYFGVMGVQCNGTNKIGKIITFLSLSIHTPVMTNDFGVLRVGAMGVNVKDRNPKFCRKLDLL